MRSRKSILVLTSSYPRNSEDWWGRFVHDIYRFMPKSYSVVVLAPHAPGMKLYERIDNVSVVRFPYFFPLKYQVLTTGSGALHSSKNTILGKIQLFLFVIAQMLWALGLCTKYKFDIIHAHWIIPQGLTAIILKLFWRIPVVITVHGTDIFALKRLNGLKSFILNRCDICTVNSSETRKSVRSISANVEIVKIPMGVDIELFRNNISRKISKKDIKKPKLLAIGRLIYWKGFHVLIEAISLLKNKYPNIVLTIIGAGPLETSYKKQVKKLKLQSNVRLAGTKKREELPRVFASSDIFILPSITNSKTGEREAQGVVVLEAFASGIPVVASRSGGIPDIVKHKKTGLLAKEGDFDDLAKQINHMISNNNIRTTCIDNSSILVSNYSWSKIAMKFDTVFSRIIV